MVTATALAGILALGATGCGLLQTNDDEIEQLRAEIIQLREDLIDIETEVSVLASAPQQTTTTAPGASSATTTTTTKASGASSATTTTTTKASGASSATTTTGPTTTAAAIPVIDEEAVLTFAYEWGPSEEAVALQTLLGIDADGWYGGGTQAAHIA
ncbi:MAG: hypothetical protein NZ603_09610, partial [Acidimicrobiales bacterium]|nr:hypothetical protein [Acidimicrobiales bacterium]